jgi:hypothetical protein
MREDLVEGSEKMARTNPRYWTHRAPSETSAEHTIIRRNYRLAKAGLKLRKSRVTGGYVVYDPKGTFRYPYKGEVGLDAVEEFSSFLLLRRRLPTTVSKGLAGAVFRYELEGMAREMAAQLMR